MIRRLMSDQEVEFKPMGQAPDTTAWLTATTCLLGIQYRVEAIAVLYQEPDEEPQGWHDPFGTYYQVAADPRYQASLEEFYHGVAEGQILQTVKIGGREYAVFFTPFSE